MTYLSYPYPHEPIPVPEGAKVLVQDDIKRKPHIRMASGIEMKHCYTCMTFKSLNSFYTDHHFWDDLHPTCNGCRRQLAIARRLRYILFIKFKYYVPKSATIKEMKQIITEKEKEHARND